MLAIFTKLAAIYLQKWSDQFSDDLVYDRYVTQWQEGLFGLSSDEIGAAIKACRSELEWPPSIAKFREFAARERQHSGAAFRMSKPLPKPVVNRDLVAAEISKMKGFFNEPISRPCLPVAD